MKIAVRNCNGILDGFIEYIKSLGEFEENYHLADILVTWQDVRGAEKELVEIFKTRLNKPVMVVEHGRGATRDYCEPNKFPLLADKICVWGKKSVNRLLTQTTIPKEKVEMVGCPLLERIKPRNRKRPGLNILLCPVISSKEEPENLLVYAKLKEWESQKLIYFLYDNYSELKKAWAIQEPIWRDVKIREGVIEKRLWSNDVVQKIPRGITYGNGFVHVKNTPIHDSNQYLSPIILSPQDDINSVVSLLSDIDVVVCLEESTLPLIAQAMGIPIVVCDIFKWGEYGGCKNYDKVEKIRSPGAYYCDLDKLPKTVDRALREPENLNLRIKVVEEEMGGDLALKFSKNVYGIIESFIKPSTKELVTC